MPMTKYSDASFPLQKQSGWRMSPAAMRSNHVRRLERFNQAEESPEIMVGYRPNAGTNLPNLPLRRTAGDQILRARQLVRGGYRSARRERWNCPPTQTAV